MARDLPFQAEMARLAQERREAFLARRGDGMAAGPPPPGEPAWMNFSGPRVPVPPPNGPAFNWLAPVRLHAHSPGAPCLEPVTTVFVPAGQGQDRPVTVGDGWFRCGERPGYVVHQHDSIMFAHLPIESARIPGCPDAPGGTSR